MPDVRLVTYDPGHFHAALVQKEMYPRVSPRVHVYAPLGTDLMAHLGRIAAFNGRKDNRTRWELEVHACDEPLRRMLAERSGNVVVVSGRNRGKIDVILAALEAGLNVLADKPWVIEVEDLPKLKAALYLAGSSKLVALDIMTERHEVTSQLQREPVQDPEVFGTLEPGNVERPGVFMESEHYLSKTVAGVALRRPAWFFDVDQQGEGLSDVGTHLVDLVPWVLFPNQPIGTDEVEVLRARRVPTTLGRLDFLKVTGEADFPPYLANSVVSEQLLYYCNTVVSYVVRGVHVWLNVSWGFEAPPGTGDRHLAVFQGSRATVEVRQGPAENYRPEVYVVPRSSQALAEVQAAVLARLEALETRYPGVRATEVNGQLRLEIPDGLRTSHEAHFAEVTRQFLGYLEDPATLPLWERANMLAKYHVTTHGVRLARASG